MTEYLRVGKILKAQGIKGEAKVFPTTSNVKRFDDLEYVYLIKDEDNIEDLSNEKKFNVIQVKYLKDTVIIKIDGIDKIEDIQKYIGYSLYVDRKNAISLLQNEYFIADLIGMNIRDLDNKFNGKVIDVLQSTKTACLIVESNKKEYLIPMANDYIKNIDFSNNLISINLVEGILDI